MKVSTLMTGLVGLASSIGTTANWTNPIRNPGGSDPHIAYSDGYYYLLTTTWTDVEMTRSPTIGGLKHATKKAVYSSASPSRCCNVWAPELHELDGVWYIYYTAGTSADLNGQRLHVLKGSADPWGSYSYAAQLTEAWGIDGSIIHLASYGTYLIFSCFHRGLPHQSICLQKLGRDKVSVTGSIAVISQPTEAWERQGHGVNEGPVALYWGDRTYITYSASDCWTEHYCLATLEWAPGRDPADPAAWTKSDRCQLEGGASGHRGTGHNSFFRSPADPSQTWVVYHATADPAGACDDRRYTMIQPLAKRSDGGPDFGLPVDFAQVFAEPRV